MRRKAMSVNDRMSNLIENQLRKWYNNYERKQTKMYDKHVMLNRCFFLHFIVHKVLLKLS